MRKASHKVEDGKMVKIELDMNGETVDGVRLRGDFFLEPPEKLENIEDKMKGLDVSSTAEEVGEKLKSVEAELVGFSHKDVGKAFRKAVESNSEVE